MNPAEIITRALDSETGALNENESKEFLKSYGLPVVPETLVQTPEAAVEAAQALGFPVVLKGTGETLLHKTERGLVHLNLFDAKAVQKAATAIVDAGGTELSGILVQPQLTGKREFVAGLFRDPRFGAVVMFGLGGVLTEALADVAFRLTPLTRSDAEAMLDEIRSGRLLSDFRGEKAVNREQLIDILTRLSQIAEAHPEIAEIDINPLIATPTGEVVAADALVVARAPKAEETPPPPVDPKRLGAFFHPKSVAVIGASATLGKWGNTLVNSVMAGEYGGKLHLVNPKGGTVNGRTMVKSVAELPGGVDLAVISVPAERIMPLIPALAAKGIKNLLIISSGFGETGEAGRKLERELVEKAHAADMLILGPNTMGMCNPHIQFYCTGAHVRPIAGDIATVAQSGNLGTQLMAFAEQQGIGIRGFAGSGNEAMITIEDCLDGFAADPVTRIVVLYIESAKNARRFYETARRLSPKKPIILLKGGRTGAGDKAAASHTGAMGSDARIFQAMCRQAGIVLADYTTDLLDLAAAFSSLPVPRGNRAAIMTLGGGWGVVTADQCAESGLEVPELSGEIVGKIDALLPPYWSRSNPVDVVGEQDEAVAEKVLEALMAWDGCDAVINLGMVGRNILRGRVLESILKADPTADAEKIAGLKAYVDGVERDYIRFAVGLMAKYRKPIYGVSLSFSQEMSTVYRIEDQPYQGIFYPTPRQAVKAFARMVEYRRFLEREA